MDRGSRPRISADYKMAPEMISGCLGPGLRTGIGRVGGPYLR
ncbi:hypothetical protein ACQP1G_31040 [Nocardia sp. CA-107356]